MKTEKIGIQNGHYIVMYLEWLKEVKSSYLM